MVSEVEKLCWSMMYSYIPTNKQITDYLLLNVSNECCSAFSSLKRDNKKMDSICKIKTRKFHKTILQLLFGLSDHTAGKLCIVS